MVAPSLSALLEAELGDGETEEQAVASNRFILRRNPNSALHRQHLGQAHESLAGFYHGEKKDVGKHTVLLPVGNRCGTTTQVETRLACDGVVACCIHPSTQEQLHGLALTVRLMHLPSTSYACQACAMLCIVLSSPPWLTPSPLCLQCVFRTAGDGG